MKKILLLIFILATFDVFGFEENIVSERNSTLVNLIYSDLSDDIDIYKSIKNKDIEQNSIIKQKNSILRKILLLRSIEYDVYQLNGKSLQTLCIIDTLEFKQIIESVSDELLSSIALIYLDSLSRPLRERVQEEAQFLVGSSCDTIIE